MLTHTYLLMLSQEYYQQHNLMRLESRVYGSSNHFLLLPVATQAALKDFKRPSKRAMCCAQALLALVIGQGHDKRFQVRQRDA